MTGLFSLIRRNSKLFFKDKGSFFSAMITPLILLVLYVTFLAGVYRSSFLSALPEGLPIDEPLLDAMVGGQLIASLLAVSCITVAFCSNMLMVQDKVSHARLDLCVSPVKKSTLALGYYIATFVTTFFICIVAASVGLLYLSVKGWYLSFIDIALLFLDIFLVTMFGTVLSSILNVFLTTQGQISAVGTIVSAGYGFVCGAYMPISQFGSGLQTVLSFLPGTYGTALIKNHALDGVFREMTARGFPAEAIEGIRNAVDCNLFFLDEKVARTTMYAILAGSIVALLAVYILINYIIIKKRKG